ncbi:MAG: cell division protein FtsW [Armatimonadetes bacterium]|nr:cell division protein FtsW [Anaerolineae bacterium]
MTDQSLPQFVDDAAVLPESPLAQPVRAPRAATTSARPEAFRPAERSLSFWATLDKPLLFIASVLVAFGIMMVFSTTFDWSTSEFGSSTVKVMEHIRNVVIGIAGVIGALLFGHGRLRRFAVPILLVAISFLVAVQLFGDNVFNARRTLIAGRFQPGETAELAMIIYMAAWLGSKETRIRSLTYGLIPFSVILGIVVGLVILQPDLSTAMTITIVCAVMFFLAGADLLQLAAAGAVAFGGGVLLISSGQFLYAEGRVDTFFSGLVDITAAHPHIVQAYIAFNNGGWTGLGLGQSLQKFTGLPVPHTDSIFAIVGEELGLIGAGVVVLLYMLFVTRGFMIARRATDPFGALLATGITVWVAVKALLNISVMLALIPPTGVTLPFISFGGSSLVTLMVGVGLLLSVQRVSAQKTALIQRRR